MQFPDHFQQAHLPTPIIPFCNFFKELGTYTVLLKRDDFTGVELSGNKVRKLDFLLKDAQRLGATRVITCGGLQSNHCRSTAFYASQLGLKTTLVLRGQVPAQTTGNLFLNQLLGVDIHYISAGEYESVNAIMENIAQQSPEKCYIIPEGGSNEIGAWGYIKAFYEIIEQDRHIETIVVATGSGGTHAGLLLGKLLSKSPLNVLSVNVCDDAGFFQDKIDSIMREFCQRYEKHLKWQKSDIRIIDGFVGAGYGEIGPREVETIKRLAQQEGIVIDPVYGAKALAGFEHYLKNKQIPGEKILFIHTGGIFGVFPYADFF